MNEIKTESLPWQFRSVQLDLARQMETPEFIEGFIDFIAANGYNSLTLYLEGRIRTKSFPYPSESESYSPEVIRRLVGYAAGKGIDVVPVVSTLGHTELFLRHPELEPLAELRGGGTGRFGGNFMNMFCPSAAAVWEFLGDYLAEIAELFPSPFFHAGCDESWDIGCCPACRERLADGSETQASVFAEHLRRSHEIITGRLGKQMIIWDDMFEIYPEALAAIPRDIVMCAWHYNTVNEAPRGHFFNCLRQDSFAKYAVLGFDYLAAPIAGNAHNIKTLTRYAARHRPLGGLLTSWEKSCSFMFDSYPTIAFAGRLWGDSGISKADAILRSSIEATLGTDDPVLVEAVESLLLSPGLLYPGIGKTSRGPVTAAERENHCLAKMLSRAIDNAPPPSGELGKIIIEDIRVQLELALATNELRSLVPAFIIPDQAAGVRQAAASGIRGIIHRLSGIHRRRLDQWQRHRDGLPHHQLDSMYINLNAELAKMVDADPPGAVLSVIFMLPDQYSAQKTSLRVRWQGTDTSEQVAEGVFKDLRDDSGFYRYDFPLTGDGIPETVTIETWGYGGQGFAFIEVVTAAGHFVPGTINKLHGDVDHPEYLLEDDLKWCFAGCRDTRTAFMNQETAELRHLIELALKPLAANLKTYLPKSDSLSHGAVFTEHGAGPQNQRRN